MNSIGILEKAKLIFEYLYIRDRDLSHSELVVGFGHFDLKIPKHCGKLYIEGYSDKILLTGGKGAGSADLKEPEAIEFMKELINRYPYIPMRNIIIECESTNTGENISFSEDILKAKNRECCFENGIKRIIAVASPYRQKRVFLCMKKMFPYVEVINSPPETTFEEEFMIFKSKSEDFIHLLLGEFERIKTYPEKGFIAMEEVPSEINEAYEKLKRLLIF